MENNKENMYFYIRASSVNVVQLFATGYLKVPFSETNFDFPG